jgi:hypothetical protein
MVSTAQLKMRTLRWDGTSAAISRLRVHIAGFQCSIMYYNAGVHTQRTLWTSDLLARELTGFNSTWEY